jgi:5-methylcytosine-specific restriction enzyme B
MEPSTFNKRFKEAIETSEALIEGEGQYGADKFAELKTLLHESIGIAPDDIHPFKLRSNSVDNCLWEGQPLSKSFRLGVAFVPSSVANDKPGNVKAFPQAVARRMYPDRNGFETILICVPDGQGGWSVTDIVCEKGSEMGDRLCALYPQSTRHEAERHAFTPPATTPLSSSRTDKLVEAIGRHLSDAKNVILQGPPGTGKTYLSTEVVRWFGNGVAVAELPKSRFSALLATRGGVDSMMKEQELGPVVWERIQLHPSYSYDDFVRGMTAVQRGGHLSFIPEDRVLVQMAAVARTQPGTKFILLLDEINRANLSAILGEVIFAIEPGARGLGVRLQYPAPPNSPTEDALVLPDNLLFLGTMNTADRSIGIVDYAVRRRFRFLDIAPNTSVIDEHYSAHPERAAGARILFESIDRHIGDDDLRIGHSYFLIDHDLSEWNEALADKVMYEVVPMLREYLAEGRSVAASFIEILGAKLNLKVANREADRNARAAISKALVSP